MCGQAGEHTKRACINRHQPEHQGTKHLAADETSDDENKFRPRKACWRFAPIGVLLAGLILVYSMGWVDHLSLATVSDRRETLKVMVADHPFLAPAVFVLVFGVVISFPAKAVLTIIGGFLFGWLAGALYAIVAATVWGTVLFLAARIASGGMPKGRTGKAAEYARGFEENALHYLLAMRFAPFIPFLVVSITPAFFNVRLKTFLAATLIGVLPGAFAYAWLGHGLDSVIVAAEASGREVTVSDLATPEITVALLALTLVAVLATIVRKVRGPQAS